MYPSRTSMSAISSNHRSGNGPLSSSMSPSSPRRPLLPLYASFDHRASSRRRYRSLRHMDMGLSQMMSNHRGSIMSSASFAVPRAASKPAFEIDQDQSMGKKSDKKRNNPFWSRIKTCSKSIYEKSQLKSLLPLLILLGYSLLGGAVVYWIEGRIERVEMERKQGFVNEQKDGLAEKVWQTREGEMGKEEGMMSLRQAVHWYTITMMYADGNLTRLPPATGEIVTRVNVLKKYTEQMAERCWEIRLESVNKTDVRRKLDESLKLFEGYTGVSTEVKPIWTFSNAVFLAVTIYTTIGYGSVAPQTVAGRVATILYAIIGIPIYLMILHKLGRVFLKLLYNLWNFTLKLNDYMRNLINSSDTKTDSDSDLNANGPDEKLSGGKENDYNIPVTLAVGVTFAWMLACAGVCCLFFETSWDYFTSFYFFFVSLTTIGFGDVTPTHPEYMFTMFGLIIVGLSLVSMCINVVQLKLELLFEEMMLSLMEEYEKSGRSLEGEMMMETALSQGGLGLMQMIKLWTRKQRPSENQATSMGKLMNRRGAFLRELQRRRRARNVGTQTELPDNIYPDTPPWMLSSFHRRHHLRKLPSLHEATQTDPPSPVTYSASSSMVTCDGPLDDNENERQVIQPTSHVGPGNQMGLASQVGHGHQVGFGHQVGLGHQVRSGHQMGVGHQVGLGHQVGPHLGLASQMGLGSQVGPGHTAQMGVVPPVGSEAKVGQTMLEEGSGVNSDGSAIEESEGEGTEGQSSSSPDLIPFIPYIEQEVPLEQEQEQPFRRWSAAEAMSIFANWAATRALRKQQSRRSSRRSLEEELDDDQKLDQFRNMGRVSGRRVTVAGGVPHSSTASIRRHNLDRARYRAACTPIPGAVSTLRIQSMQPSRNDVSTVGTGSAVDTEQAFLSV